IRSPSGDQARLTTSSPRKLRGVPPVRGISRSRIPTSPPPIQISEPSPEKPTLRKGPLPGPLRSVGFSGDGSEVWIGGGDVGMRLRLMLLTGGTPRNFLGEEVVNLAWSPDGERIVYHTFVNGDPMFVADRTGANARRIFGDQPGLHNHFPTWSPDGRWIYFSHGTPATGEMDLWRIDAAGGNPERLTQMNTDV